MKRFVKPTTARSIASERGCLALTFDRWLMTSEIEMRHYLGYAIGLASWVIPIDFHHSCSDIIIQIFP